MNTSFIPENIDQELSIQELAVATGGIYIPNPVEQKISREIGKAVENFGRLAWKAIKDQPAPITGPFVNTPIM
jgi:hypothetical protein